MDLKGFPLNQQEYAYNAQDVMKYYAGRNSGVFESGENLKVSVDSNMQIKVATGAGWLSRDYEASLTFWNDSVKYLMLEAGHSTLDRIDLVVVTWDFIQAENFPQLIIRKGTPASSPAVPSLVNNSSTIEIALARINVGKGSIELHDADIVDLRGDDTYCPMVYDEQTIRETFRKCVGYADGVNKISDFPSATPASSDKILIEQGGEGKSTTIGNAVNTCSLTYEEIMASTDLTNKVASASAVKDTLIVPNYSKSNAIAVTELTTVGGTWTAPSNGVLKIYAVKDNDGLISEITIRINYNTNNEIRYKCSAATILYCTQYIPLRKGDVLKTFTFSNIYSGGVPMFFPSI